MTDTLENLENFHVESLFGAKLKKGLIHVKWNKLDEMMSILDAKKIAYMILECCEGAATDEAVFNSFPPDMATAIIMTLRQNRGKQDPRFFED